MKGSRPPIMLKEEKVEEKQYRGQVAVVSQAMIKEMACGRLWKRRYFEMVLLN